MSDSDDTVEDANRFYMLDEDRYLHCAFVGSSQTLPDMERDAEQLRIAVKWNHGFYSYALRRMDDSVYQATIRCRVEWTNRLMDRDNSIMIHEMYPSSDELDLVQFFQSCQVYQGWDLVGVDQDAFGLDSQWTIKLTEIMNQMPGVYKREEISPSKGTSQCYYVWYPIKPIGVVSPKVAVESSVCCC